MRYNESQKLREGLSMIEAMVALLVLSLVSSAVILMSLQVLSLVYSSRLKNQAVSLAEQVVEQVRGYYQTNSWAALANWGKDPPRCFTNMWSEYLPGNTCVNDSSDPQCSVAEFLIPGTSVYRYMLVSTSGTTSVQLSVVVTYMERGVCKKTQIDTYFYNY